MIFNLKSMIAPVFYKFHRDLKENRYTHYFLQGGRGSTKSSVVSIELPVGVMKDKNANAIVFRKYGTDLKDSVFNQLLWAIDQLGVSEYWHACLSPLRLIYKPTGQQILFRGIDDPHKSKSIKLKKGFFKFIWFEEADQFCGMEEIRTVTQSLIRGGEGQSVLYTYNPPKSVQNWINKEVLIPRADRAVYHSTYLDVPPEWLGQNFLNEAETLKAINERSYRHEYLGEVTGTGGEVFDNINLREITDEEIKTFEKISRGIDFGFSPDPTAYVVCCLHNYKLYIFYEFYKTGTGLSYMYDGVSEENKLNDAVYGDCAEPRTINELKLRGLNIHPADKGPDSVAYGITYLQDLYEIVIDPVRCPETAREFSTYELERDKNGLFRADFPDKNNHSIDAVRYALCKQLRTRRKKAKPVTENSFFTETPKKGIVSGDISKLYRR